MNSNWVPLWSDILVSSIWSEPLHVRVAWIALLAMKDRNGEIRGDVRGLARMANLEEAQMRDAIERFTSEDEHSKSSEFGGRRLEPIEGGWRVLNHQKYIESMRRMSKRTGAVSRQERARGKRPQCPHVDPRVLGEDLTQ